MKRGDPFCLVDWLIDIQGGEGSAGAKSKKGKDDHEGEGEWEILLIDWFQGGEWSGGPRSKKGKRIIRGEGERKILYVMLIDWLICGIQEREWERGPGGKEEKGRYFILYWLIDWFQGGEGSAGAKSKKGKDDHEGRRRRGGSVDNLLNSLDDEEEIQQSRSLDR